ASSGRGPRVPPWWPDAPAPATYRRRFRRSPRAGCGPSRPSLETLGLVLVLQLARRRLLQGDRQVVPAGNLDHRRRVLAVRALGEGVVVGVDLASPLRRDENGGVVGVGVLEKLVDSGSDH